MRDLQEGSKSESRRVWGVAGWETSLEKTEISREMTWANRGASGGIRSSVKNQEFLTEIQII